MAKPKFPEASPEQISLTDTDTTVQAEAEAEGPAGTPVVAAAVSPVHEDPPPAYCHVFPEGTPSPLPRPEAAGCPSPMTTLNGMFGPHSTLPAVLPSARCPPPTTLSLAPAPGPQDAVPVLVPPVRAPVPRPRSQVRAPEAAAAASPLAQSSVFVVAPSSAPVTPVSQYPAFTGFAVGSSSAPPTPRNDYPPASLTSPTTPLTYFPGFAVAQQSPTSYSSSSSLISATEATTQVFVVPSSLLSESTRARDPSDAEVGTAAVVAVPGGGDEPLKGGGGGGELDSTPERRTSAPAAEPEPYSTHGAATSKTRATPVLEQSCRLEIYPSRPKYVTEYSMYGLNKWQRRVLAISITWSVIIFLGGALGIYFIAFEPSK
ncbi:E3 ubiquitin-protein ligase RNF213 [Frankliniella fusca]|uniref:E3 ubiquitin-protein ligase RNF213 n=1 Tax=Frankliniella fusca TaxID=407009 RepID=A0AAE1LIG1_9NEOP|nr:E3 ubiquitin-protein ligase RNF213 [Frankliniella fusca]